MFGYYEPPDANITPPTASNLNPGSIAANSILWVDYNGNIKRGSEIAPPIRQTVLNGPRNTSLPGAPPTLIQPGAGLSIVVAGSAATLLSFAAGYGAEGEKNSVGRITSNQTLAVEANATSYIYADIQANGNVSVGASLFAPIYAWQEPIAPALDQHWLDFATGEMQRWQFSWRGSRRLFLGQCTTNATNVLNIITYAYRGYAESAWFPVARNQNYTFAHNLGVPLEQQQIRVIGRAPNGEINYATDIEGSRGFEWSQDNLDGRLMLQIRTGDRPVREGGSYVRDGDYKIIVQRAWDL